MITIGRVYEPPAKSDGYRVLIDALWPRGMTREKAKLDEWLKEIAPSAELRRWFDHEDSRWADFRRRYRCELAAPERQRQLDRLRAIARRGNLTLLYAARNETANHAIVVRDALIEHA